jgi:hypothetical protein
MKRTGNPRNAFIGFESTPAPDRFHRIQSAGLQGRQKARDNAREKSNAQALQHVKE